MKPRLSPHGLESTPARRNRSIAGAAAIASMLLASCGERPAPRPPAPIVPTDAASTPASTPAAAPAPAASTPSAAAAAGVDPSKWRTSTSADDPAVIEVAGFRAPKPAAWIWTKPSMQFRTLQYTVPGGADSTLSGELIVSVFVAGDGGPIDANIERWRKQFRVGDGFAEPKRSSAEVGPLKVEYVELAGDYMAMGAPAIKKDQLQLGAIVQAEGRNVFFRLIGPAATVEANRADFMKLVEGLMPAD